jgi:sirohydrochlorin ferrochelatase/(2Fe-2S) ferredoxin
MLDDEAIVLAGHGSRRERSNEQVRELAAGLEARLGLPTDAGFIELAEPSIEGAIDSLAPAVSDVTVIPLSLFAASHVKADVPLVVNEARAAHDLAIHNGHHLGVHPAIVELLDDRAAAVEAALGVDRADDDVVAVVCARGSSDPDSNGDVHKLARLLYEGRDFLDVEAAFIGVTEPLLEDALHTVSKRRPDAVVVVPYMLGDGVLTDRIRERTAEFDADYPYAVAGCGEPLGTDDRLLEVLADRFEEARTGDVSMSCDTCKYKVDLEGFEGEAGGARAMLRAMTHRAAHEDRSDVDDEPHVHDAPDKHVAVCTNRTCAGQGATELLERLRRAASHRDVDVTITRSSCLDRCGEGPNVAVYPDGVWYGGVSPDEADSLAASLAEDRIVSRLVDQTL